MATYDQIRDAIVAQLNTIPDIGRVEDYRRHITTYADLENAYLATIGGVKQIRAVSVNWESANLRPDAWTNDGKVRMIGPAVFCARYYMSANDAQATDKTFSGLLRLIVIALVKAAFALVPRQSAIPVTLASNGYVVFGAPGVGDALCHTGEVRATFDLEEVI